MTSRERVQRCLKFETPDRVPRDIWALPWAWSHYPAEMKALVERFPSDFGGAGYTAAPAARERGDAYTPGTYTDAWGCEFLNIQAGAIGEVRAPIVPELSDWRERVRPPMEILPEDPNRARDEVNRQCADSTAYIAAGCCPRPWERMQFLRGTVNAMMDVMTPDDPDVLGLIRRIHEFNLRMFEFWVTTDVDSLRFMDDWGTQRQLLIPPAIWRELFKPLYKDYCDIAHSHGKSIFMHSDGHISEIYGDLVEIGVDALNSQLFCMDMADLEQYRGKITFWGEIDRQHVLCASDPEEGRAAVRKVASHLYDPRGGVIAQCEIGLGSNPAVWPAIFDEWEVIGGR